VLPGKMLPLGPWTPKNINVDGLEMTSLKNLVANFSLPVDANDVNKKTGCEYMGDIVVREELSNCEDPAFGKPKTRRRNVRRNKGIRVKSFGKKRGQTHSDQESPAETTGSFGPACINLFDVNQDESEKELEDVDEKDRTTVVVKSIPRHYTMGSLYQELSFLGFADDVDYMNMLEDKKGGINRGYAFVNFRSNAVALRCMGAIQGHEWRIGDCVADIPKAAASWALVQGFLANSRKHPLVTMDAKRNKWTEEYTKPIPECLNPTSDPVDISGPADE